MKNVKNGMKLTALLMALVMTLCACGTKGNESTASAAPGTSTEAPGKSTEAPATTAAEKTGSIYSNRLIFSMMRMPRGVGSRRFGVSGRSKAYSVEALMTGMPGNIWMPEPAM